jgi:bifunctional N-acetylglucosamine-1-phosphate-uridyltransferase/glucosamine-1-phosphate-acetyltransferase GlmU-like protein
VRFAIQPQPLGTGDAVECARESAGDADFVLIMNGDVPLVQPATLRRLMAAIETAAVETADSAPDLALLTAHVPVEAYGYVELMATASCAASIVVRRTREVDPRLRATSTPASTPRAPLGSGRTSRRSSPRRTASATSPTSRRWHTTKATPPSRSKPQTRSRRGVNDRIQLASRSAMRDRIRRRHMLAGVNRRSASTFIDADVTIDGGTSSRTHLRGATSISATARSVPAR